MVSITEIENTDIFCVECEQVHTLKNTISVPFFISGKSYKCPVTKYEIARTFKGKFVYWNGNNFVKKEVNK